MSDVIEGAKKYVKSDPNYVYLDPASEEHILALIKEIEKRDAEVEKWKKSKVSSYNLIEAQQAEINHLKD